MELAEREKLKKQYIKLLKHLGWTVAFDADEENYDSIFDLKLFLQKVNKDAEHPSDRINYGFLKEAYTSDLSLEEFDKAFKDAESGAYAKFMDKLDARIYPFDINDVIAQCLHLGLSIETFYHINSKGKLTLELDPDLIERLIDLFVNKHSPLVNLMEANKPKKLKKRAKTYLNPNPQIPKDVLRD